MKIIEKDFKIEYDGVCYVLYFLKSKKELKEDAQESFKIAGYYTDVYYALRFVYSWRLSEKYPFKEPVAEFKKAIIDYKRAKDQLAQNLNTLYNPIYNFKQQVFDAYKPF